MADDIAAVTTVPTFPLDGSIKTLGWGVVLWMMQYLVQPDGDEAGEPFKPTREQINFLLWFYAVNGDGHFIYRRATLRRSKGWGKSPLMAAIALAELCGPVSFWGFDKDGNALGQVHPMPWVVVAGIAFVQTANTMDAIRAMAAGEAFSARYLDENSIGQTRIIIPGGGKIVPITASSRAQEGARPTFAILDETHHWTASNGGHKLAQVIRRNLAKVGGRSVETTNAHEPGEDSTAEKSYQDFLAQREGKTLDESILYDSREAPGDIDLSNPELVKAGLKVAYGDAVWLDLDRLLAEVYDPSTSPEEARRFYLNQIVAAANSWVAPHELEGNRNDELAPLKLGNADRPRGYRDGDTVVLGFDGSLTDDSTALAAIRLSDGAVFLLGLWEKPEGPAGNNWEVPKDEVRETVDHVFARLDVIAFFSDVAYWETDIDHWRALYSERLVVKAETKHTIGFDMRSHLMISTQAAESMNRTIVEKQLPFGMSALWNRPDVRADEALVRHILNARRRLNRFGVSFGKESRESPKKVDALAALMLAYLARSRVIAEGKLKRRGTGRVAGF